MNEQLKKEVEQLLAQGYNASQIKEQMTEKGYKISEINEAVNGGNTEQKGNKLDKINTKKILKYTLLVIIGYIVISFIVISFHNLYKDTDAYESNPENWVSEENDIITVDVDKISGGVSEYDGGLQQFNDGKISTAFIIEGWYDGEYFRWDYYNNGEVIVNIGNEINPDDDVMDIFISEIFEDGEPYFDIFLDKKWQENLGTVKIWYGKEFENYREFNFTKNNEIRKGVFHNRIKDDIDRFIIDSDPLQGQGGLMLGDLDREDWLNKDPYGKIIIMLS